ncbi:hypothetical protein ACJMK2_043062 [Sinanodonta woodiana]|uniref:Sodium/nucleoside cotransporter n=1 Tax=Sinanodonta woodiana TaxID=1069815 RepID=A0ABD3VVT6_SINWO
MFDDSTSESKAVAKCEVDTERPNENDRLMVTDENLHYQVRQTHNTKTVQMDFEVPGQPSRDKYRSQRLVEMIHIFSPINGVVWLRFHLEQWIKKHKRTLHKLFLMVLCFAYFCYLGYAAWYRFGDDGSVRLVIITALVSLGIMYHLIKQRYGMAIYNNVVFPIANRLRPYGRIINRYLFELTVTLFAVLAVVIYIILDVLIKRPRNAISAVGLFVFVLVMFFFSKHPDKVIWRPVLSGLLLQFIFALIVLRSTWGYYAFDWLGDRITDYMKYAEAGSKFIFGEGFMEHYFVFQVMPVLIFFSATIGILYYLGWIQVLIEKIAFMMEYTMGTAPMETLHAAVNIFVGWGETLTIIWPLLDKMTLSELHTVMTNGFATVAGSTLGVYIMYGAPANHLLSASVMSAPAALAMSKLFYPETVKNKNREDECKIPKLGSGIIDAASIGAVGAISIVAHILVSVIAFISLLEFVNVTLQWFGDRVGLTPPDYPSLTFQLICSYIFWPMAYLMGVEPEDCSVVARMVGIKTFVNEFIAYEDLGIVKRNREAFGSYNGTWHKDNSGNIILESLNQTLKGGIMSIRSEMIATYALCGFSNVVALGIMIGAMTAIAPNRKQDILSTSFRALLSGCMACFMTACIAENFQDYTLLYRPR